MKRCAVLGDMWSYVATALTRRSLAEVKYASTRRPVSADLESLRSLIIGSWAGATIGVGVLGPEIPKEPEDAARGASGAHDLVDLCTGEPYIDPVTSTLLGLSDALEVIAFELGRIAMEAWRRVRPSSPPLEQWRRGRWPITRMRRSWRARCRPRRPSGP